MNGYSPLARGYLGMDTLRDNERTPVSIAGNQIGTDSVMGGMPTNVGLITANGINSDAITSGSDDMLNSLSDKFLVWTTLNSNNTVANGASNDMISSKYYNNEIIKGTDNDTLLDDSTKESDVAVDFGGIYNGNALGFFDMSNSGTAVGNGLASNYDDLLAKVVGGSFSGYTNADYFGFMPNGQMTIFRTGAGMAMQDVATSSLMGTYTAATDGNFGEGAVLTIGGISYTVELADDGHTFSATDGGSNTLNGYLGADGLLYLDTDTSTEYADVAYEINGGSLMSNKEIVSVDYLNYEALRRAAVLSTLPDNLGTGKSQLSIVANASIVPSLRNADAKTVGDMLAYDESVQQNIFSTWVNDVYDVNTTDNTDGSNALPSVDSASFFNGLGSTYSPLVIFSTGAFDTGNSLYAGKTLEATFENSAPLVYDNLEHLFMSVVAVGVVGGTDGADNIAGYNPDGKITLTQWQDTNGTAGDTSDDFYYKARSCGVAGLGGGDVDPWCFAAAGITDELAVSSMAGAAGAVQSAFDYLSSEQVFILLALTADGGYLGANNAGETYTEDALIAYLQNMYELPNEYQFRVDNGEDYLDVFSEVYGYGLVDLERATKPTSKIYYYSNGQIVADSGEAYWRKASTTRFSPSSALSVSGETINAPFYDILESHDGSMSIPRIWENEFALGNSGRRGLYMGDVLGGMKIGNDQNIKQNISDNVAFSMNLSESADINNVAGLDWANLEYSTGNLNFAAGYQNYFTDKKSRFDSVSNPILSMASDAFTSDIEYEMGDFSIGFRAFSANITDESLLENDPTVTNDYEVANLGLMQGGESSLSWNNSGFGFIASVGSAIESDTLLGAYSDGLLNMGSGETYYMDMLATYNPSDDLNFSIRSTFAKTTANNPNGEFILGLSDLDSNAFSASMDWGNFSFAVASPLAITSGNLQHMYTEYEVVETDDNVYDLVVKDSYIRDMDLSAADRELRFSGYYNTKLGVHTDGSVGFIYRINPEHTKQFGNESIFMFKLKHSVGI